MAQDDGPPPLTQELSDPITGISLQYPEAWNTVNLSRQTVLVGNFSPRTLELEAGTVGIRIEATDNSNSGFSSINDDGVTALEVVELRARQFRVTGEGELVTSTATPLDHPAYEAAQARATDGEFERYYVAMSHSATYTLEVEATTFSGDLDTLLPTLTAIIDTIRFAPPGPPEAYALDNLGAVDVPQDYQNDEIGLSFSTPEFWDVALVSTSTIYVANDAQSMGNVTVRPGDLFNTIQITDVAEWGDRVDTSDGVQALEVAQWEEENAANDTLTQSDLVVTNPAVSLPDFALDAALVAGVTNSRDWLYIILIPNDTHVIRIQAATLPGALQPFLPAVFAFADTLRYDGRVPEILRLIEERREPRTFQSDDNPDFSFPYRWWIDVTQVDPNTAMLTSNPAAEDPWPQTTLPIARPSDVPYNVDFEAVIRVIDRAEFRAEQLTSPLSFALERLDTDFPDAEITDELERDTGASGIWARVYATTPDGLQVSFWVVVPAAGDFVAVAQLQTPEQSEEFNETVAVALRELPFVEMLIYSGQFPPGG